jgi:excisionase family DNA binding protein
MGTTITRFTPIEQLPEMLRPEEAAAVLGVSKGLVYELCRRGDLASVRLGRLLRIPRSAIESNLHVDQRGVA